MSDSSETRSAAKHAYLVVGIVAAAVSAATVAYIFWRRSQGLTPQVETVQQLLDRCNDQIHNIEQKLGELSGATLSQTASA